jgi:hypothetical protein
MKHNIVKRFAALRTALYHEKSTLEARLSEINTALDETPRAVSAERPAPVRAVKGRRKMSAAGRASIAAALKARWVKVKSGTNGKSEPKAEKAAVKTPKKRKKMSAAAKAKISAAAKARWAKGKTAVKAASPG